MSDQDTQVNESQKTVTAFIAGLLVGGLLVWIFSGSPAESPDTKEMHDDHTHEEIGSEEEHADHTEGGEMHDSEEVVAETPTLTTGDGNVEVGTVPAGTIVSLDSATFPTDEGWVAVRTYSNDQLGSILGAARYSKEQGLVPQAVELLAPTVAGRTYAIVFFSEDGNRTFNLDGDVQLDTELTTFVAQ